MELRYIPTNNVAPFSPPTQHHSFFRNLPPFSFNQPTFDLFTFLVCQLKEGWCLSNFDPKEPLNKWMDFQ